MNRVRFAKGTLRAIDVSRGARILGAMLWVIVGVLFWWWSASAAEAQGKGQTLCTPIYNATGNLAGCTPVGMTGVGAAWNWLPVGGIANAVAPTSIEGRLAGLSFDLNGNLRVSATFTPSGTQNVNLTQILGAAPSLINPLWVFPATGATFPVSGTVAATQSGTWTIQPGNTPNTTPWLITNTLSSAAGAATISASSTAAASNLVLKGSAGNLYSLTITIGATSGYAMLFDATSLPSNGAVTPVWCYPVTSNGTNGGVAIEFANPKRFGTGITAGFSTTGCFTLTASATGNFFGGYQ